MGGFPECNEWRRRGSTLVDVFADRSALVVLPGIAPSHVFVLTAAVWLLSSLVACHTLPGIIYSMSIYNNIIMANCGIFNIITITTSQTAALLLESLYCTLRRVRQHRATSINIPNSLPSQGHGHGRLPISTAYARTQRNFRSRSHYTTTEQNMYHWGSWGQAHSCGSLPVGIQGTLFGSFGMAGVRLGRPVLWISRCASLGR